MTVSVFDSSGTFTWPDGESAALVEAWGGGGGHGVSTAGEGGGGGGAYAASIVTKSASTATVTVGAAGTPGSGSGGDSSFVQGSTTNVLAQGGFSSGARTGGPGGSATTSTGTVKFGGGAGGTSSGTNSGGGGGGSSASRWQAGVAGSGTSTATGGPGGHVPHDIGGGAGGNGGNNGATGTGGTRPGGGGSGGGAGANGQAAAPGRVVVTCPPPERGTRMSAGCCCPITCTELHVVLYRVEVEVKIFGIESHDLCTAEDCESLSGAPIMVDEAFGSDPPIHNNCVYTGNNGVSETICHSRWMTINFFVNRRVYSNVPYYALGVGAGVTAGGSNTSVGSYGLNCDGIFNTALEDAEESAKALDAITRLLRHEEVELPLIDVFADLFPPPWYCSFENTYATIWIPPP